MHSLSRRLLISVSVPIALFCGVVMLVLDTGFRAVAQRSLQEELDRQMVALIAAVEPQPDGGYAPAPQSLQPSLETPGSGVYAQIRSAGHQWRSPSTAGLSSDFGPLLSGGERSLSYATFGDDRVAIESRSIQFEGEPAEARSLTFSVATSLGPYQQELWRFRRELGSWFLALMMLLLVTLAALLHWVLGPVRRMEREIHEVEEGQRERLGGSYPRELAGVARNLNALLIGERKRVARYRDTLGNLAHSLKTPLAVMRAEGANATVSSEIDRMSGIIEHQLKRAAASGGALLGQAPVEVSQVAAELRATLLRVYAGKDLAIELAGIPGAQFIGDRGDLTELLGNLLDNACKWCRTRVRFSASSDDGAQPREKLSLVVEDDGPGISADDRARVLQRGVRADEKVPGHGLGLAMVHDTVDLYGGSLAIDGSPLGGARFTVRLPGR
ncbi:MAG: two-component sensor histidine kinase [Gammaproteobacteria bacterium]|nr:two-component sensor histidine kinase [Gammaproteobacteria bacterium]MBV8404533.1 two-component sensor histidine kinase [Gammaproteobacteria bacterium]